MVTYCPLRQNHMTTINTLSRIPSDVYVSEERLFMCFLNFLPCSRQHPAPGLIMSRSLSRPLCGRDLDSGKP